MRAVAKPGLFLPGIRADRTEVQVVVLTGILDSPFVRRIAITMQVLGSDYHHRPLSIFESCEEFRRTAVAWNFMQRVTLSTVRSANHPYLIEYRERAEALPAFLACQP